MKKTIFGLFFMMLFVCALALPKQEAEAKYPDTSWCDGTGDYVNTQAGLVYFCDGRAGSRCVYLC